MSESGNQPTKLTTPITLTPPPTKTGLIVSRVAMVAFIILSIFTLIKNPELELRITMPVIIVVLVVGLFSKPHPVIANPDGIQYEHRSKYKLIPWEDIHEVRIRYTKYLAEECVIKYGQPQKELSFVIKLSVLSYRNTEWLLEVITYQARLQFVGTGLMDAPIYKREQEVG